MGCISSTPINKPHKDIKKPMLSDDSDKVEEKLQDAVLSGFKAHLAKMNTFRALNNKYQLAEVLGRGITGEVRLCTSHVNGSTYAMKSLNVKVLDEHQVAELKAEIEMLKVLDHPYIVSLIEIFESEDNVSLVMEFCGGGDLASRRFESEKELTFIIYQILRATAHCHFVGVVHRDLKLENVLFKTKDSHRLRVIDFGLSTLYLPVDSEDDYARALETVCGTYHYMAPEVLARTYSSKADIWAIGVIAYILLTGKPPFNAPNKETLEQEVKRGIVKYDPAVWDRITPAAREFTQLLLTVNPEHRPSAKEALQHPWLHEFRLQYLEEIRDDDFAKRACQNLLEFTLYPMLKKAALMIVSYHANLEEKEKLQDLFLRFDDEFIGELSRQQLFRMVDQYLPGTISESEFEKVFDAVDQSRSTLIHLTEFLAATIETTIEITPDLVNECFNHLDLEAKGFITVNNLTYLLGRRYSEKDVQEMFRCSFERIGLQPKDTVNLVDFSTMMHWEPPQASVPTEPT